MAVLGYLTKLKRGLGLFFFWCTFPARFFHRNVPYLILDQLTKFESHTLFHSQSNKMCY